MKRHPLNVAQVTPNLNDNYVDFKKLPPSKDIPSAAKQLLYRPAKMAELKECYDRIGDVLNENYLRNKKQDDDFENEGHRKMHF